MKQIKRNSMKMVISIVGMAICLLSGCMQDKNEEKNKLGQGQETDGIYTGKNDRNEDKGACGLVRD